MHQQSTNLSISELKKQLDEIVGFAIQEFENSQNSNTLNDCRIKFLGDKSFLVSVKRQMKDLPPEIKPEFGKMINEATTKIQSVFEQTKSTIETLELNAKLEKEKIDPSLPGLGTSLGAIHPLTQVTDNIVEIFENMGFSLVDGPEIETTYYN